MKNKVILHVSLLFVVALSMVSCSENDNKVEEFADWQNVNEAYFQKLYTATQQKIASGDTSWKIIRNWSTPEDNTNFKASSTDHIIVHVLNESTSTSGSPLYSDSVKVNYRGRLVPSASYVNGYVFDQTYTGTYNPQTAMSVTLAVRGVVDGFSTALQNVKIGDRWEVYIPYQLGYQTRTSGTVPAYSTLIFDMALVSFYRAGVDVPEVSAKANNLWVEE